MMRKAAFCLWSAVALALVLPGLAGACPFCAATSQTLSEEMTAADAAVLAQLVSMPDAEAGDEAGPGDPAMGESIFRVKRVLRGQEHVAEGSEIKALHFGEADKDTVFLLNGQLLPDLKWGTPIPLASRAEEYVGKLLSLPEKGGARLAFFQEYFEDEDPVLAQDAYDEFARAPFDDVKELKDQMHHDRLVAWIKDPEISPSHRRLYLTMLSVCGGPDDLPMLEEMMRSDDRRVKAGLDAMIACYLTLEGPEGMPLVEQLFLDNKDAEYADTYAAIMALRFHGQETDVIPKERLLEGLRHMLDRPELADLVISDLARWEDWSVRDRLVELFKTADETSSWVRVPVINYLQACAKQSQQYGDEAEAAIKELEKIDPSAVKQAQTFAAFGGLPVTKVEPSDAPQEATAATTEDAPAPSLEPDPAAPGAQDDQPQATASSGAKAVPAAKPAIETTATVKADSSTAGETLAPAVSATPVPHAAVPEDEVGEPSAAWTGTRIAAFVAVGLALLVAMRIMTRAGH